MIYEPKKKIFQFVFSSSILLICFFVCFVWSFAVTGKSSVILRIISFAILPFCYVISSLCLTRYVYEINETDFTITRIYIKKQSVLCRISLCEIEKISRKSKTGKIKDSKLYRYSQNLFLHDPLILITSYRYDRSGVLIECDEKFENFLKAKTDLYKITEK